MPPAGRRYEKLANPAPHSHNLRVLIYAYLRVRLSQVRL